MNIQTDTYHQIVNSMTFPLVIINLQKKITIINVSGEDFFKTSSKMVIGKDIRDFMPFSSPIINLIDKCIDENSNKFNEVNNWINQNLSSDLSKRTIRQLRDFLMHPLITKKDILRAGW